MRYTTGKLDFAGVKSSQVVELKEVKGVLDQALSTVNEVR